jgi:Domain of unknown function (DUF4405)
LTNFADTDQAFEWLACSSPWLSQPLFLKQSPMIRKLAAIGLFVSFLAMSTSGMMMFVIERPSFTLQMHPVHKLFGLVMIISVVAHLSFNYRALLNHLKARAAAAVGGILVVLLVVSYGVALNKPVPADLAQQMDAAAAKAEGAP